MVEPPPEAPNASPLAIVPALYFLLVGTSAIVIGLLGWRRGIDLSSCAGWSLLTLLHGLVIKPLFVAFNFPDADILDLLLFSRITRDQYWLWGCALLLPYLAFTAAMLAAGRYGKAARRAAPGSAAPRQWLDERVLFALLAMAVFGIVLFFMQFPQLLESANKNSIATTDVEDYNGGGIWRSLIELSYLVSLCALLNVGAGVARGRNVTLFAVSAGLWLVFCFLSDQRGLVIFSVVAYFIAYRQFVGPISKRVIVISVLCVVAAIGGKTLARIQSEVGDEGDIGYAAANLVGQNLVENGKTISIIQATPADIAFQFGKTYVDAILILVPRALYPQKETVNLDTVIGTRVFGCDAFGACGVPPGVVAESFLNFGPLGVVILPIAAGIFVGRIDRRFRLGPRTIAFDLFYVYSLVFAGMAILGSGISGLITQFVTQGVTLALVLALASRTTKRRRATTVVAT
jgi:oligosaccharide repeat unit polymerase